VFRPRTSGPLCHEGHRRGAADDRHRHRGTTYRPDLTARSRSYPG